MIRSFIGLLMFATASLNGHSANAQSDVQRINTPQLNETTKIYRKASIVTGYDARRVTKRNSGRVLLHTVDRKLFHLTRRTKVEAGTHLFPDTGDWHCTQRDNYYAGGSRFGKMCFRDSDGDGAFEKMRMGRGFLTKTLDPPVQWSELQSETELQPLGLRKSLVYRGFEKGIVLIDYVEFVVSSGSPTLSRSIKVPLPKGSGVVTVEGVTLNIVQATEFTIEYEIVSGLL